MAVLLKKQHWQERYRSIWVFAAQLSGQQNRISDIIIDCIMNPSGKSLNHLLPGGQVDRTAMNIMACIVYKYI
ncbi:MAG: hypothetical protein DBY44_04325 [Veillonellaceae bacterium]|nr:MAG: hypothetical protein DBY44_04325 [Veillonellaceae bacterium]